MLIMQYKVGTGTPSATRLDHAQNSYGATIDSSDNVYVIGNNQTYTLKYNGGGTLQWQRLYQGGTVVWPLDVAADAANDLLYVVGMHVNSGGDRDWYVLKYDLSGNLQWQERYGGQYIDTANGVAIDGSQNAIVVGYKSATSSPPPYAHAVVLQVNSSGVEQWARLLDEGVSTESTVATSVAVDGSDNIYVVGYHGLGSGNVGFLVKYDSSGVLQWQKRLNGRIETIQVYGSDLYMAGFGSSTTYAGVAKYDTAGNFQWYKRWGAGSSVSFKDVFVDATGVYTIGGVIVGANSHVAMTKWDHSGNLDWSNTLGGTSGYDEGYGIVRTSSGYLFVTGHYDNDEMLVARLPADGTGLGTYGPLEYATTSQTVAVVSENVTTSLSDSATNMNNATTPTTSEIAGTLTEVAL